MKKIIWLLLTCCLLSGCAVDTYVDRYVLNNTPVRKCCGSATPHTLLVSDTTAAPGYDTDQILYLKCLFQLKSYSKNRWAVPPSKMLNTLINQTLVNTCYFKAVVVPPFVGKTSFVLQTRLMKLQQEFFCCPSRVRMVVQAVLVNGCTSCPIAEQTFCEVVLAPQNNACGGVIAANRASQRILQQITDFVVCHVNRQEYLVQPSVQLEEPNPKFKISTEKPEPITVE